MAYKYSSLVDERHGRLLVLSRAQNDHNGSNWNCRCDCGVERVVRGSSLRNGLTRSCGCLSDEVKRQRRGVKGPGWKGGKTHSSTGYVLVQMPSHPAATKSGYVAEHRLVMENKIGRFLTKYETVHHINGNRTDNRENNLELWASRQPKGQRVSDLIEWAKEILILYGDEEAKIPLPLSRHIGATFR